MLGFENKNIFFSQEGEDMLLSRIFDKKRTSGFFLDIGAHHPKKFSNTYYFYKKGWRGINIDPLPGTKKQFDKLRPKDINIEIGISKDNGYFQYYMFKEPAYNTFSEKIATLHSKKSLLIDTKKIKTKPLKEILEKYLNEKQEIDFLSIDTEGLELEILKSNDWSIYIPKVIIVEDFSLDFSHLEKSLIYQELNSLGYIFFSKLFFSTFYVHKNYIDLINRV